MALPAPKIIEGIFVQARRDAIDAHVAPEYVDNVAAILAALQLKEGSFTSEHSEFPSAISIVAKLPLRETIAEWAHQFSGLNHMDRFNAAASYLFEERHKDTFDTDDIIEIYSKARWNKPSNPADIMAKAAKRLFFAEADEDKSDRGMKLWQLTNTGYDYYKSLVRGEKNV